MLDNLTTRLAKVVKTMRGEARLTESNTAEMLREVRMALLEADVALPAVREFIAKVKVVFSTAANFSMSESGSSARDFPALRTCSS